MRSVFLKCGIVMLRILASTWRISVIGEVPKQHGIIIVWHGFMLVVWKLFASSNAAGITSHSKDGDILAALLHSWKYKVIRGSSSKGGTEVLEQMLSEAKNRKIIITPDGPRGPAYIPKAGAFVAAQRSGIPLYPCIVSIDKAKYLNSWDSFAIPLPFAQCCVRFLPSIEISHDYIKEDVQRIMDETASAMKGNNTL